jgi:hypothetical protein
LQNCYISYSCGAVKVSFEFEISYDRITKNYYNFMLQCTIDIATKQWTGSPGFNSSLWGRQFSFLQNVMTVCGSSQRVIRPGDWGVEVYIYFSLIKCIACSLSQKRFRSRPTLLFLFEFPLIHMIDIGMGNVHSVCRKVVTDTGCVYGWSHSCVRCICVHECQRLVEGDPQFNLEIISEYSFPL